MRTVLDAESQLPILDERKGVGRQPHSADTPPPATREELAEELEWCHEQLSFWAGEGHLIARDAVIRQYRQRIERAEELLSYSATPSSN